jgi:hypothetical protein
MIHRARHTIREKSVDQVRSDSEGKPSQAFHTLHIAEDNEESSRDGESVFDPKPKEEPEKAKLNHKTRAFKIEGYLLDTYSRNTE